MVICSFLNLIPQKREDTIGSFDTKDDNDECHPRAVPCQDGPDFCSMSSGREKVSIEVVRKS